MCVKELQFYFLQGLTSWKFPPLFILLVCISILLLVHIFCDVVVPGGCVHSNILFYGSRIVNFMLLQTFYKQKYVVLFVFHGESGACAESCFDQRGASLLQKQVVV